MMENTANQMQLFESLQMGTSDMIVPLPTEFVKNVISHLCGHVLPQKPGVEAGLYGMTLMVVPLTSKRVWRDME